MTATVETSTILGSFTLPFADMDRAAKLAYLPEIVGDQKVAIRVTTSSVQVLARNRSTTLVVDLDNVRDLSPGTVLVDRRELKSTLTAAVRGQSAAEKRSLQATFTVTGENEAMLSVDGYGAPVSIVVPDDDPFDDVPDALPGTHVVDRVAFTTALNKILPAAGTDDLLEVFKCADVTLAEESVTLSATDRYRIARAHVDATGTADVAGLLPAKLAAEVLKHIDDDTLHLSVDGDTLTMNSDRVSLRSTKTATYPNLEHLFQRTGTATIEMPTRDLLKAANRVAGLTSNNTPARIEVAAGRDDQMLYRPYTDRGPGVAPALPATVTGYIPDDGITVGINPKYLLDTLKTITAEHVTIELTKPGKPVYINADDEPEWIIMAMRLH